ncbi:hypothetical protein C8R45DRAFT_1171845 [Mycena sanguinolenta]|nr:hypothetical protein C8R45DRAFT_1171845 [Mycena sanguinolenta]
MPSNRRHAARHLGDQGTSHEHSFSIHEIAAPENAPIPAFIHHVSDDRRRVYVEELAVEPPSPVKRKRLEETRRENSAPEQMAVGDWEHLSLDNERYEVGIFDDAPVAKERLLPKQPHGVKPSDPSLSQWRAKRNAYLAALIRRDGTGNDPLSDLSACPACRTSAPEFRCRDCFGDVMYCQACLVENHRENPLHRIEKWHRNYFVRTTLARLGLRIQLGHPPHQRCAAPEHARSAFVTLHINGIHEVAVDFCGCKRSASAGPPEMQLLHAGWFPATHERPQTCATISVLETFHQDTLQSKMTMYDFYGVLEKLTDNTGIKPPDRYHEWIRMCREFRHLMLLKRGGHALAYTASGVDGTQAGELAIQCPACPRPNINLPDGWENVPLRERFLYTLFLALDACFRLKRRLVSSELKDPDLGPGWAYMVDTGPYREYLRDVTPQKEQQQMNTCSGLAALDYANTKFSRGYSTTGVGMVVCARHEFVQPNGVGDLQKGERFSNMDYIFASVMLHKHPKLHKLVTYDIACIWKILLRDRLKSLPPHVRLVLILAFIRFAIPKMHIHSHTMICQLLYSLNLILGSAQGDAEGIERAWVWIGAVAGSTRDMGPGSCHDVLDCQWSYWNWQKLIGIVELLRRCRDRAEEELKDQAEGFEEFSEQQAAHVLDWRRQVLEYEEALAAEEADESKSKTKGKKTELKSPYETEVQGSIPSYGYGTGLQQHPGLTEAQVRLQFTKEEAEDAARGVPSVHDVSPSSFISAGLDLEEEQRRVRLQAELKKAGTTGMQINLAAMRTKLNRGLARFRKIQAAYMPAAIQTLGDLALPPTTLAEDVPLLLPSAWTDAQRSRCAQGLEQIEALLRDAQCRTALMRLRNQLHIKSRLLTYKKNHVRHQGANTRSRTIVTRNESKIRLHSEKYQVAWDALRRLNGGDKDLIGWRVLKREDIRCMEDEEDLRQKEKERVVREAKRRKQHMALRAQGLLPAEEDEDMEFDDDGGGGVPGTENRRQVSWIWVVAGSEGTDAGLKNALRIEWSKAFARTRRWDEELRLVNEEFRRVCLSFEDEERKWRARAAAVPLGVLPLPDAEGAVAYALRHADMYTDLREQGIKRWNEEKLARGKKHARHVPAVLGAMEAEARAEEESRLSGIMDGLDGGGQDEDDEDEDEGLRGDVQSDEEYILGGEGFDD